MNEDTGKTLADRLMEADGMQGSGVLSGSQRGKGGMDPSFELLLAAEQRFEARVRRLALFSWALTFASLVLVAIAVLLVRDIGSGTMIRGDSFLVQMGRFVLIVFGTTGVLSFLAAALTSVSWLFRSRTPTLRAIERRLAALETLLTNPR